ncbi:MAG: hypothetical protein R1F52_05400 [Candidatus Nitrosoabyssus spongiisocia]|nr:MAG: hypothetical protein R1F52_05400 [Nitrosopumilaceae archaeon AB1(1)]
MISKKGLILTITILGAITIASSAVWFIPTNFAMVEIVQNFDDHLDGVKNIYDSINDHNQDSFKQFLNDDITFEQYAYGVQISTDQINEQIIRLVKSQADDEWVESYVIFINALREYNSYLRDTILVAEMLSAESSDGIEEKLENIRSRLANVERMIEQSYTSRP